MSFERQGEGSGVGSVRSPGGFEFGIQGWSPGEPRPTSITFFLDGSCMVCDQHGHAIRGALTPSGERVWFATTPPSGDRYSEGPIDTRYIEVDKKKVPLATHAQVITALDDERIDWRKLSCAGWPQLPYDQLKKLPELPPTPEDELRKIKDTQLRRDALRIRREVNEVRAKEAAAAESE